MTDFTIQTVTAPASEPVTVFDAQEHLGVTGDTSLLEALITAARMSAELFTRRAFITQTLRLNLHAFPHHYDIGWWDGVRQGALVPRYSNQLALPRPPLQSVTSVTYFDTTDSSNTFAASNYQVITTREPGVIQLDYGATWPSNVRPGNAVQVEFVAGYGLAAAVPAPIKRAILMEVASLYNRRDGNVASESIDNASVTFVNEATRAGVGARGQMNSVSLQLLQPYRVVL